MLGYGKALRHKSLIFDVLCRSFLQGSKAVAKPKYVQLEHSEFEGKIYCLCGDACMLCVLLQVS